VTPIKTAYADKVFSQSYNTLYNKCLALCHDTTNQKSEISKCAYFYHIKKQL